MLFPSDWKCAVPTYEKLMGSELARTEERAKQRTSNTAETR